MPIVAFSLSLKVAQCWYLPPKVWAYLWLPFLGFYKNLSELLGKAARKMHAFGITAFKLERDWETADRQQNGSLLALLNKKRTEAMFCGILV